MEHNGGKAEDIALGFDDDGIGGIVNNSRGLMCAFKNIENEEDYALATRNAALKMRDELNEYINMESKK